MKKCHNANHKSKGNPMPAMKIPLEIIAEMTAAADSGADPNGSYTGRIGRSENPAYRDCISDTSHTKEKPIQDADDL